MAAAAGTPEYPKHFTFRPEHADVVDNSVRVYGTLDGEDKRLYFWYAFAEDGPWHPFAPRLEAGPQDHEFQFSVAGLPAEAQFLNVTVDALPPAPGARTMTRPAGPGLAHSRRLGFKYTLNPEVLCSVTAGTLVGCELHVVCYVHG